MALVIGSGTEAESTTLALTLAGLTEADFSRLRVCYDVPGRRGPHVSATQLIEAVTKTGHSDASHAWSRLKSEGFLNVTGRYMQTHRFRGQRGGRPSEVVDIPTALQIIMVLPGKTAAKVRVKASVLLTRFLGGDVTLVGEVYGMNELQNYLREHHPEHSLAAFREAVEVGQTSQDASDTQSPALQKREGVPFPAVVRPNKRHKGGQSLALDEARLDWKKDLKVATDEVQGVKAQFTALLHIEIQKKKLPDETRVGGLAARPPLRFRELAFTAVSAYRLLFADGVEGRVQQNRQSQDLDTMAPQRPGGLEASTDGQEQHADGGGSEEVEPLPEGGEAEDQWHEQLMAALEEDLEEDDDILKVSEVMRAAGVSRAVWLPFRSDLSNKLLALKCEQTQGAFAERRPEVVRGGIPVFVHKYKKSQDWPLAWQAVQKTQHLYQKRVRECLEGFYHTAGIPLDPSIADLARRVAEALRTH